MAKIGLAFAGAGIGFLLGGPAGAQIGFSLGGILGSILFPGRLPPGPRVNDLIVTSATNGAPIPICYGQSRIAGNIIWAPPIVESAKTKSAKGGPKQTTYTYTASFAVAFCEGPATIGRVWFDSKIVYDPTSGNASITGISQTGYVVTVTSTLNPSIGSQVTIAGAPNGYNGKFKVLLSSPTSFTYYNTLNGLASGSGGTASIAPPKYAPPVLYPGNEDQQADPTIQAAVGAANCPAFRGLCYAVWTNFPLSDFGNRIPNVRAEVTAGASTFIVSSQFYLDNASSNSGSSAAALISGGPATAPEAAIVIMNADVGGAGGGGPTPGAGWTALDSGANGNFGSMYTKLLSNTSPISVSESIQPTLFSGITLEEWAINILFFGGTGSIPSNKQTPQTIISGAIGQGPYSNAFASDVTAGNAIIVVIYAQPNSPSYNITPASLADSLGNSYISIGRSDSQLVFDNIGGTHGAACRVFIAQNIKGGHCNISISFAASPGVACSITAYEIQGLGYAQIPATGSTAIVGDICSRAGLQPTDLDLTQILNAVPAFPTPGGYVISRPMTAQAALKPLALAFFFDAVESGGVIRFVPRGQATATLTVPESDLGLEKDKYKITEQIGMAQDLPREFQVLFNDKSLDYQQNKQHKRRHTRIVKTKQETVIELPMTIDSTTARQIAEKALFLAYLERKPFDVNLWKSLYLLYDPTDVIQFVYEGLTFQMRIVKLGIGADFQVAISGVNEDANNYLSSIVGSSGTGVTPGHGRTVPDTVLFLFDIPLLRDGDANPSGSGYYFAMSSLDPSHWPGASLQKSSDNVNFAEETTSSVAAHYGNATTILGAPLHSPWVWDTVNTLTISMTNGTLAGTSDINVLNGANALLVGSEVIQYANAVQNADGSFTISRLLRGRRGTEVYCGTHGPSEIVVDLINPGMVRQQTSSANLQVLRYFRPVTFGLDISTIPSQLFTDNAQDLLPYAPTSLAGARDGSGNLTLSWIRRTRIGGDWLEGIGTVPLSETVESYDVDILKNGSVVRTFSALSLPTVVYTASQQTADFGSAQAAVVFNVYQNSSAIGRGFKASATV